MKARDPIRYGHGVTIYTPNPDAVRQAYRIVWRDRHNQRRNVWRNSLPEAEAAAAELVRKLDVLAAGNDPERGATNPLTDLLDHYLDPANRRRPWSANHERERRSVIDRWIRPHLGHIPCRDLTTSHLRGALADMRDQGATDTRIRRITTVLKGVCAVGAEDGWLTANPAAPLAAGPQGRRQGQASVYIDEARRPTTDAVERLAEAAADTTGQPWRALEVRVAAYCGLRWGELHELRTTDIDLDAGAIHVTRQVTHPGGAPHLHLPKYEKRRVAPIVAHIEDALAERIAELDGQPARLPDPCGCATEAEPPDAPLLFPNHDGRWQTPSNHSSRVFRPACEAAGWPRNRDGSWQWTWHDLRHHACTWMLAAPPEGLGLEVADVALFAGHATPDFTWRAYVAARPGAVDRARAAAQRIR